MKQTSLLVISLAIAACTPTLGEPTDAPNPSNVNGADISSVGAEDDGTYLSQIDPLGGNWQVKSVGQLQAGEYGSGINFSGGGFLNHGGRCGGGSPAFYSIDGSDFKLTRKEQPQFGKCDTAHGLRFDRALSDALDQANTWTRTDENTAILTAADGTQILLERPPALIPEIFGDWKVNSIGKKTFAGTVRVRHDWLAAQANCNTLTLRILESDPGRLRLEEGIQTLAGCGKEKEEADDKFFGALAASTSWRIDDQGRLVLAGGPGMILSRPAPPNRALVGRYEQCGSTQLATYYAGPVTLEITEQAITDNASCVASYTANGPHLALQLGDQPACQQTAPPNKPHGSIEIGGDFSPLALLRPDGFGFSDEGVLKLRTERGLLSLCRKSGPRPFAGG